MAAEARSTAVALAVLALAALAGCVQEERIHESFDYATPGPSASASPPPPSPAPSILAGRPNGAACTSAAQCASGGCEGGVCCPPGRWCRCDVCPPSTQCGPSGVCEPLELDLPIVGGGLAGGLDAAN